MSWLASFSSSTAAGLATASVIGGVVRPLWREHVARQKRIEDQLDPSTPGGVTAVIDAIKETKETE